MLYDREKQKGNANRSPLAVAGKLVAYLVAVDRRQKEPGTDKGNLHRTIKRKSINTRYDALYLRRKVASKASLREVRNTVAPFCWDLQDAIVLAHHEKTGQREKL